MKEKYSVQLIRRLLIANRGEIASRIIRTCRKMGIVSIAVYSDADRNALFVREADTAYYLGESRPESSYLNQDALLSVARRAKADAIHPGYGFLSENYEFAKRCQQEDLLFIGPHYEAIEQMGSKALAKSIMAEHGVPVIPGYQGENQDTETLEREALKIGFPILIKASAGGGGKGMRIVHKASDLSDAIASARREAINAFGNDRLIIEKYIKKGRHIEFQIFGDQHGNVLHLFERECSLQRRYQKIIEESPSPVMNLALREKMAKASIDAAMAIQYDNAGTVEFILDQETGEFYFLEVNTRLQVEHPVTEAITGLDLVALQISSATGKVLPFTQDQVQSSGYAIEARIYAEDPMQNFQPVTGIIQSFRFPRELEGFRIETAITDGSEISIFYDPMIAKVIVWSQDRSTAIQKLNYALRQMICAGITTNLSLLIALSEDPQFIEGDYDTGFIPRFLEKQSRFQENLYKRFPAIAAFLFDWNNRSNQRDLLKILPSGWRNNPYNLQRQKVKINDHQLTIEYKLDDGIFRIVIDDEAYTGRILIIQENKVQLEINEIIYPCTIFKDFDKLLVHNEEWGNCTVRLQSRFPVINSEEKENAYITPMPAQIVNVLVAPGQQVKKGDTLVVLSSMKMESSVIAENDGVIEAIYVGSGTNVAAGFQLLKFKEST